MGELDNVDRLIPNQKLKITQISEKIRKKTYLSSPILNLCMYTYVQLVLNYLENKIRMNVSLYTYCTYVN